MAKTIIQSIGPLYGDVVNGTVFGRPNGSVYVPPSNTIHLTILDSLKYVRNYSAWGGINVLCSSAGAVGEGALVAESQDSASYMQIQLSDDSDFGTFADRTYTAGQFNTKPSSISTNFNKLTIVDGTTYYCRAILFSSNGVPVATSSTIELTGVEV